MAQLRIACLHATVTSELSIGMSVHSVQAAATRRS